MDRETLARTLDHEAAASRMMSDSKGRSNPTHDIQIEKNKKNFYETQPIGHNPQTVRTPQSMSI